jgi:hypothetical protein
VSVELETVLRSVGYPKQSVRMVMAAEVTSSPFKARDSSARDCRYGDTDIDGVRMRLLLKKKVLIFFCW